VYVSNESNLPVYFDNLVVTHTPSPILEETHYYPFGLPMAGISSKALKSSFSENKKKFNGIEFTTALGLSQYDAFYRNLDAQIGRWWQMDPKPDVSISSYVSMNNNPIRFSDPLGDTIRIEKSISENKLLMDAFNRFASTKSGKKFLSQYAAKGQTIAGHTYTRDGVYSKGGADINYSAKVMENGASGRTTASVDDNGRGQVNISLNSGLFRSEKLSMGLIAQAAGSLFHESLIHGDLRGQDFLDNKKFDYSNISNEVKKAAGGMQEHYHHYKVLLDVNNQGYNNNNLWPRIALEGIRDVLRGLGIKQTDQEINKEMWDYRGGIQLK
jgi:RHS repeat-associated protein